jgi:formyltetrahydrofolate deformylase
MVPSWKDLGLAGGFCYGSAGMKQFATLTVIGKDKTGVIARITSFLFEQKANIEALEEQVTRGQFSMTLQASWRKDQWRPELLLTGLNQLAAELAMEIKLRTLDPHRSQKAALFVTKESHCPIELLEAFKSGELKAEPVVIISNRPDLEVPLRHFKVPFVCINDTDRAVAEKKTLLELDQHEVDFVILARYMRILSPDFVWRYKNKIINIHPSLLPSFPGAQAYRQAYERGVKVIGVTAHFVTMDLDEGPIIAQDCFRVTPNMSLKDIVAAGQNLESKVLLDAVRLYLAKRLDVYWGIVKQI